MVQVVILTRWLPKFISLIASPSECLIMNVSVYIGLIGISNLSASMFINISMKMSFKVNLNKNRKMSVNKVASVSECE